MSHLFALYRTHAAGAFDCGASAAHHRSATAKKLLIVSLVLALLFGVGTWTARWADSLLLGVVAANLAFVMFASLFTGSRANHR